MDTVKRTKTIIKATDGERFIGKTADGDSVFVKMELTKRMGSFETTWHREVTEYTQLSVSGCVVEYGHRNAHSAGQIIDSAREVTESAIGGLWLRALIDLWERCHLNGMHGECRHQERGAHIDPRTNRWAEGDAWDFVIAKETAKCPKGYRYGSKWLVKVMSYDDMGTAKELIDVLNERRQYKGN